MKITINFFAKSKVFTSFMIVVYLLAVTTSCTDKEDEATPPDLPPIESMTVDFNKFSQDTKSAAQDSTSHNYAAAGVTVFVWNFLLGTTLAVPVATFYASFNNKPVYLGDATWQWTYNVNSFGATYTARLTGKILSEQIKWEMNIARAGINPFSEFKWFEGTSDLDGNGGQWILFHSHEVQENVLQIDWKKDGEEVGDIKYTYIRESSNGDNKQLSKGSYIQYGLQDTEFNAFYTIHSTTRDIEPDGFKDVNIEWSTSDYYGRIKAPHYIQFLDNDWHCWNNEGVDIVCE